MQEKNVPAFLITYQPNVFYLSGFSGSSGFLLITTEEAILYTDFRYLQQAREEALSFEVVKMENYNDFSQVAAFLKDKSVKNLALEESHLNLRQFHLLKNALSELELLPLHNFVEEIRAIKEEKEVELIIKAANIADEAWMELIPLIKPGITELEVACELEYRLRKKGSEKNPFEIIVASGERSALPHGAATSKKIRENELVIVDFGAVYGGYCSDMTRTFCLGEPSSKQLEIYNMVLEAQEMAFNSIKAGQRSCEADLIAREYFMQQGYEEHFGHGLGHGVGIEVHELPTLSPKGTDLLQEMMVFSVEPGIYMENWGGVRVEDLVLLRPEGLQIITKSGKDFVIG